MEMNELAQEAGRRAPDAIKRQNAEQELARLIHEGQRLMEAITRRASGVGERQSYVEAGIGAERLVEVAEGIANLCVDLGNPHPPAEERRPRTLGEAEEMGIDGYAGYSDAPRGLD